MNIKMATKKSLIGLAFTCGMLMSSGMALAVPCSPTSDPSAPPAGFVGLQFGTVYCGNDPFGGQVPLAGEDGIGPGDQSGDLLLSLLGYNRAGEIVSGTWTLTHHTGEPFPTIMLIKAGNAFFLQSIIAGVLTGMFDTALLDSKGLSHISLYGGVTPAVPLPAALPLLLTALCGLTWLSRRRKLGSASTG